MPLFRQPIFDAHIHTRAGRCDSPAVFLEKTRSVGVAGGNVFSLHPASYEPCAGEDQRFEARLDKVLALTSETPGFLPYLFLDPREADAAEQVRRAKEMGARGLKIICAGFRIADHLAPVRAAAEMGLTRAVLASELSLEQIKFITKNASIETEVFVHGALCFCHSGQCYMSAMIGRRSGNRGMCAQPCRMQYSLGSRMDDYPLSLKDNCLADRLQELEEAGVACLKIEGRMKRPEYAAIVTGIYAKALREHRKPSAEEMSLLEQAFSRQGFTQGYFNGDKKDMFGVRRDQDRADESVFTNARKAYADGELRRVPVHFYTVAEKGKPVSAIAFDDEGHRAVATGPVPERAKKQGLTAGYLEDQMFKTGGTPYYCVENRAKTDEGLFLPAAAINELRRSLIAQLSEERAAPPQRGVGTLPRPPKNLPVTGEPKRIFQVLSAEQMIRELAELKPDYLYAPALVLAENPEKMMPFLENGVTIVAVLPRILTDPEQEPVVKALEKLHGLGVREALVGNLGHVLLARRAGMALRGDFGLNAFNSQSLDVLQQAGFLSATASFELRLSQIRDLRKPLDTEMIVYGRLPLMVSDQCIIKESSGRCNCQQPAQMADRMGSVFPVVSEYGCRNVIYNAHKLYLADKQDEVKAAGLWAVRLVFSTESPRECVEVARGYLGLSDYRPNVLTRGLYYRGVE